MADIAASVLARLKTRLIKVVEATSFACSFSARKNFCADWKSQNTLKTLF